MPEPDSPIIGRSSASRGRLVVAALARAVVFFVFWLLLTGAELTDLAAGLVAAAFATWTSLWLLPPHRGRFDLLALARFALRFAWQSVVAGFDVARRVFDPRLPLKPGLVAYPVRMPPGTAQNAFTAITSLMPGTVPVGPAARRGTGGTVGDGAILYHCLDTDQPVAAQLAIDESMLARTLGLELADAAPRGPGDSLP